MGKSLTGKELGKGLRQRKDGIYSARYTDRFGNRKEIYNHNLAELKRQLKDALRADIREENTRKDPTLNEWFDTWMNVYKSDIRSTTRKNYTNHYNALLRDRFGNKLLKEIRTVDLQDAFNKRRNEGISFGTLKTYKSELNGLFVQAVADDYIRKNPMSGVKLNMDQIQERVVLSSSEQLAFFTAAKGNFFEDAYIVQASTGMRPGELFALVADRDIDFDKREIAIRRTLVVASKGEGRYESHDPKTKSSLRTIPFGDMCEQALRRQIARKKALAERYECPRPEFANLLFVTRKNGPLNAQSYNESIKTVIRKAKRLYDVDIPQISGHCFRHCFATRCFEAGMDLKIIQRLLGHSKLSMTADLYTHVLDQKLLSEHQKFIDSASTFFEQHGDVHHMGAELSTPTEINFENQIGVEMG